MSADAGEAFRTVASALGKFDRELSKALRSRIRNIGKPLAEQVKAAIAPYSKTVARSITLQVSPGARGGASMSISAKQSKMPERSRPLPALLEGRRGASFRHPVFGDRNTWVQQPAHPFLERTLAPQVGRVQAEVLGAVDDAARVLNTRGPSTSTITLQL